MSTIAHRMYFMGRGGRGDGGWGKEMRKGEGKGEGEGGGICRQAGHVKGS